METEDVIPFSLKLRIPGWCKQYEVSINDAEVEADSRLETGYLVINRSWNPGDEIHLKLVMPIERVYAHPEIKQNRGSIALQRGPIVYCLEQVDHEAPIRRMVLPNTAELTSEFEPELLNGVIILRGKAMVADTVDWEGTLYRTEKPSYSECALTAIPYYAWANRVPGEMRVWITEI